MTSNAEVAAWVCFAIGALILLAGVVGGLILGFANPPKGKVGTKAAGEKLDTALDQVEPSRRLVSLQPKRRRRMKPRQRKRRRLLGQPRAPSRNWKESSAPFPNAYGSPDSSCSSARC